MNATRKKTWLGLALALTVAVNTLLPFFATYSSTTPPSGLAALFGEKVLVCTGDGFVWVKWEDLASGKAPVKPHKSYFCPLCYIANNVLGKILLLSAGIYLARSLLSRSSLLSYQPANLVSAMHTTLHSRAPPFSFSY